MKIYVIENVNEPKNRLQFPLRQLLNEVELTEDELDKVTDLEISEDVIFDAPFETSFTITRIN
jgi:hypothetical protein